MVEKQRKEVKVSVQFETDLFAVFEYGEEMFGLSAAISFVTDIYEQIQNLDKQNLLHPECRHLPTKDHRYRNIIFASYLIIYRITENSVEVLRILHGHSSIRKIKSVRSVKSV